MKHIDMPVNLEISNYPRFNEKMRRFYEELEYCSKEFKKILDIVYIIKEKSKSNNVKHRNLDIINFNFNFLLGLFNLFKFDQTKKIEKNLFKIYILKIYDFVVKEFAKLRKTYENFHYFSIDEEKRYLEALRVLCNDETSFNSLETSEINLLPSKIGFLYLRYIRYYIFKVNKYIFKDDSEKNRYKLSFYNAKFSFLCVVSVNFLVAKKNNLFEQNKEGPRWQNINKICDYELVDSFSKGEGRIRMVKWFTNFMNALYYSLDFSKFKNDLTSILKFSGYTIYYGLHHQACHVERIKNITAPSMEITKLIFEAYESWALNIPYTIMREKTNFDKIFHLMRENKKLILKSGKFVNTNSNSVNSNSNTNFKEIFNLRILTNLKSIKFEEKVINLSMENFYELLAKTLINYRKTKSLNISKKLSNLNNCKNTIVEDLLTCDILFYIHGGGFLSQSTESVIGYLSDVGKEIPCVIFAMDYTLAPQKKIEEIVQECNTAFKLLMDNLPTLFRISPRKIVLSGDSAGGFLSLNLTNFLIQNNMRKPDGLVLIYPCTRLYFREMCPSSLLALTDSMIDSPFLSQLLDLTMDADAFYQRKIKLNSNHDFFLTEESIVRKFPKCYVISGSLDPIRDECYRFLDFMSKHGVSTEMKEYLYFPHGFMNITSLIDRFYYPGVQQLKSYIKNIFSEKEVM